MFNAQLSRIVYCFSLILLLASCGVQKEISRSAEQVIKDSSLVNAHIGISVFEPATSKYWFNYQEDKYFVPASNTKIPTCYAAMKYLGDSLVGLRYQILGDSMVMIWETGDPSFLHPDFKHQPVFGFLKKFKQISFRGTRYNDFLGNGWSWNDYKEYYMVQRSGFPIYGNVIRLKWESPEKVLSAPKFFQKDFFVAQKMDNGFEVIKSWEENKIIFWNGAEKNKEVPFRPDIATISGLLEDTLGIKIYVNYSESPFQRSVIHSQPTDSLLKPMMHRSDNFFAEQSLLMVSNEKLGIMNDAKIIDAILKTDLKDLPQKPRWVDGSGLSRYNLFTPQDLVAILNKMKIEFGMERLKVILPTGGEGTLSNYFKTDSGYIYGKTGTLSGVVAFSGFLYTKKGKLLIFSTLVNNHQSSATAIRKTIEKFLREIRLHY
jgi:serine-type D-Ala-D-Ala carboxypeptidase/endopeptidase (penicillin-binding protein 4)